MTHRSARSLRGSLVVTMSAAALVLGGIGVYAQQPPAAAPAKPAAKPAPKPPAPAAQKPAQAPQQPAAVAQPPAAPAAAQADMPPITYSPWSKLCSTPGKDGQDANSPKVCATMRDGRTDNGIPVVSAALIEPDGVPKKILRITVPAPLQLQFGTRIIVDSNEPATSPYFTCIGNACMADYDGSPDLVGKLKKGQTLNVQAINLAGTQISFLVPLAEFAKVNEGPAMDPEVYKQQQEKEMKDREVKEQQLREKLQKQGQQPATR